MEQPCTRISNNLEEAFILDDKDIQPYRSNFQVVYMPAKITNHKIVLEINNLENAVNAVLSNYMDT